MNVAAHQDKEKNEKTGKSRAGEERRLANFKEAVCYPSAVVQGGCTVNKWFVWGSARGNWDPRQNQQPFRPNPNGVGDCTTTLRRLLIGAVKVCSLYMYIYIYITQSLSVCPL